MKERNRVDGRLIHTIAARHLMTVEVEHAATRAMSGKAGWSTKAGKPRRPTADGKARAKAVEARVAQIRRDWAKRHPQLAAEEREIRKANADQHEHFGHKLHGTVETHAKASKIGQGPLQRLLQSGAIDDDQAAWGEQIAAAYELITADVRIQTCSGETRVDVQRRGDGTFFEAVGRVRLEMAYTAWRDQLGPDAPPALDMIVGNAAGFTVVAKRYSMHNRRAKKLLIDALDAWPGWFRHYCKMVDQDVLDRAHAALA